MPRCYADPERARTDFLNHRCRAVLSKRAHGSMRKLAITSWGDPQHSAVPLRPVSIPRTHAADPIHLNTHDQSLLSGPTIRIFVQTKKTFCQLVNVHVGTRAGDSPSAVEDRVCLRVVAILNRDHPVRGASGCWFLFDCHPSSSLPTEAQFGGSRLQRPLPILQWDSRQSGRQSACGRDIDRDVRC
jgi:hypothetical protein